jgi:hypothetical protein
MSDAAVSTFSERWQNTAGMQEAIRLARLEAIRRHAQAGRDLPLWQDGKVVWVPAQEILSQLENGNAETLVKHD